jgi:hypothetical protein
MEQGWKPMSDEELTRWFLNKHGDDAYTREIDRRWRSIGRMIEKGTKIRDGRLG